MPAAVDVVSGVLSVDAIAGRSIRTSLDGSALTSPGRNHPALESEWRQGPNGLLLSLRESPSPLARTGDIPVVVLTPGGTFVFEDAEPHRSTR